MTLTIQQINLVRDSFGVVLEDVDIAGRMLYDRLFELDPSLRELFHQTDIQLQGRQFVRMILAAVTALEHPDTLREHMRPLGQRHINYGVQPAYYQTMCQALIWMINRRLGPAFTPEVQTAWEAAYEDFLRAMEIDS